MFQHAEPVVHSESYSACVLEKHTSFLTFNCCWTTPWTALRAFHLRLPMQTRSALEIGASIGWKGAQLTVYFALAIWRVESRPP